MNAWMIALALALGAPPAGATTRGCRGELSGAVEGKLGCAVRVQPAGEGTVYLSFDLVEKPDGVPGVDLGSFEIALPLQARTYALEDVRAGRAAVYAKGGTIYSAYRTTGRKGEVTLRLTRVKPDPDVPGGFVVSGSYRARLPATASPKEDEVVVSLEFQ
jgi:hypothetical protein